MAMSLEVHSNLPRDDMNEVPTKAVEKRKKIKSKMDCPLNVPNGGGIGRGPISMALEQQLTWIGTSLEKIAISIIESTISNGVSKRKKPASRSTSWFLLHLALTTANTIQLAYREGSRNFKPRAGHVYSGKALKTPQRHIAPGIIGTIACIDQK